MFPASLPLWEGPVSKRARSRNGLSSYTRQKDVIRKLNSVVSAFRDDWYWGPWSYQEIETTRIIQESQRLMKNRDRQAIDWRLSENLLLQQSRYGHQSIVNEDLTFGIPGFIRTGETYFQRKEKVVNSIISTHGLPTLFITLTFNENWHEFKNILTSLHHANPHSSMKPSNHPWEGV